MAYTITIDSVDRTTKLIDDGFAVTQSEGSARRASVKLYEQLYALGDELKISIDGNLKFQGEIDKESIRSGEFVAYASDLLITLPDDSARADGHFEYENQDYTVIFKDLLDYYFSGVFDVSNVDTTGQTCSHINLKDRPISECLQILATRAQYVFWLEPPNYMYFKPKGGVSSGYSAVYGHNIADINVVRDTFVKTKVIVKMRYGAVEVGSGSRITVVHDDTITTEEEAEDVGNAILDEMQDVIIRGDITLLECKHDLVPGTTIVLTAPRFGFNADTIRIKSMTYTPFRTKLVVGTMTSMVEHHMIDIEDRIKNIEKRGLAWLWSCESSSQTAAGCSSACEIDCEHACEAVCEPTCQSSCQSGCQYGECETGCQTTCQKTEQITCIESQQICGTAGVCQTNCLAGHGCETACQSQCQAACQSQCQLTCQESCQGACEAACQGVCETTCQTACLLSCMDSCEITCKTGCQTDCQTACEDACQTTCESTCQETCESTCQTGCEQQTLCCGTIGPF